MSSPAISIDDLAYRYDRSEALHGLSLPVQPGECYGFLGRNGAGKTTTLKVLLGMTRPTSGDARVFGLPTHEPDNGVAIRRRIAFVSDDKDLYDYMTIAEMIAFTRPFFPKWRADLERRYIAKFELPLNRGVKELSRGTRTKLALLLALVRGADLLILDEPTSGLDPAVSEDVLQALVSHVSAESATVFFSSHQLAEVEQIADHVAIIDRGQTVVSGPLDDLRARYQRIQLVFDGSAQDIRVHAPGSHSVQRRGRVLTVLPSSGPAVTDELRGYRPVSLDVTPVTLKDIFLESVRTEE